MNINLSNLKTPSNFIKENKGVKFGKYTMTRKRLYQLIETGEIPHIEIDGRIFIDIEKINK